MEAEFDCGTIVKDVGVLTLALKHHLKVCTDDACIADVRQYLTREA